MYHERRKLFKAYQGLVTSVHPMTFTCPKDNLSHIGFPLHIIDMQNSLFVISSQNYIQRFFYAILVMKRIDQSKLTGKF